MRSAVARQLGMRRVVVPRRRLGAFRLGHAATDIRYELARTHVGSHGVPVDRTAPIWAGMEAEGRARLAWFGASRGERGADMRYGEQIFEIDVPLRRRLGCEV